MSFLQNKRDVDGDSIFKKQNTPRPSIDFTSSMSLRMFENVSECFASRYVVFEASTAELIEDYLFVLFILASNLLLRIGLSQ